MYVPHQPSEPPMDSLPHITPYHQLDTLLNRYVNDWEIENSLVHLPNTYDPLRPHINPSTCCWSMLAHVSCGIPPHMTPFHHLWTKSLILSHDWSISLSHLTPYDPLRPHINRCCWSVLSLVPCGIPTHMTPFHPLRTLFGISNQHIVCSISYPHPLWPPKTPYQPQSLECFSFPTPYDPLSPPMNLISYIESWLINLFSLPHPIWPPKTPYQPMYLLLVNASSCFLWHPTPYDPLSPPMNHISYIELWLTSLFILPHPIWPP